MTSFAPLVRVLEGPDCSATMPIAGPVVVGRAGDLRLTDATASRHHLRLEPTGDGLRATDLGSASGSFVGGRLIDRPVDLHPGDAVTVGANRLMVLQVARFHPADTGPGLMVPSAGGTRRVTIADRLTIGRDSGCDVVVPDPEVSRVHAVVRQNGPDLEIEDQGSSNGTRVNGRPVAGRMPLRPGDRIELGQSPARLLVSDADEGPGTVAVRLRLEGSPTFETLNLEASRQATVAEVTEALAAAVAADPASPWLLYRPADGIVFHPDDEWSATGPQRGDELVLGRGDASELPVDQAWHWPRASDRRVNQLPRTHWPTTAHIVARPTAPETTSFRGRGTIWQVVGGVGAIIVGLSVAIFGGRQFALFGIMAGAIGVVTVGASIAGDQSRRRHGLSEYRRKLVSLDEGLGAERQRQIAAGWDLDPETAELATWIEQRSPRLWERRPHDPDALRLRIGRGRQAMKVEIDRVRDEDSPFTGEFDAVLARYQWLDDVPVCGPGRAVGGLGIAGDPAPMRELAARMVIEAACVHAPAQLRIWVVANRPEWEWVRWLPHGGPDGAAARVSLDPAGATDLLNDLRAQLDPNDPGSTDTIDLVVVDLGRAGAAVEGLIRDLSGRGLVVVLAESRRDLPNGLGVVIDLDSDGTGAVVGGYPDAPVGSFVAESIDAETCERLALGLGGLGPDVEKAASAGLLELLGLGDVDSLDVTRSWASQRREPLTVAIGADSDGDPVTIGFRRDGPHGMVAGTTGSGKSELLQTLLVALAVTHPPTELSLFLIDFKGGATFAPLATLPHVVGLVTDLESDGSLATRAFTALDAEIERRKRLLDGARVANIIEYSRSGNADGEALPNLLVVIDEFALLVERQPEVKDRLDTVATQGRSLGIHLLLATQSPSGVISHAIRTNTNLWVCLRVVSDSESMELLGSKDAARLPDNSPGRGFVRLGAGEDLRGFQAARIARPRPGQAPSVVVRTIEGASLYASPVDHDKLIGPATEMDLVVERIVAAATDLPAATPLWLPPLPEILPAQDLSAIERPPDRLLALVGVVDRPERQSMEPFVFDLTGSGHALVSGLLGFGKSTSLLQVGADLATHLPPSAVHLYGIEAGGGSLAPLTDLPHIGAVVGIGDSERLMRVLVRLASAIEHRRELLADAGAGSFTRWRSSGGDEPWIVLLLDDYPSFREAAEQIELGRPLELFNSILQNGPAVGIHIVVAISQSGDLRLSQTSLIPARLLFRQSEAAEYGLLELRLRPSEVPMGPPGRALAAGNAAVQVAQPDSGAFTAIAERWRDDPAASRPQPVERLPKRLARAELPAVEDRHAVLLGLGGPELRPVTVALGPGSGVLLVAGPSRSGRSTTMLSLFDGIVALDPSARCTIVALRPSPLRDLAAGHPNIERLVTAPEDVADALDTLTAGAEAPAVLIIDDAEGLASAFGAAERLDGLVRRAAETGLRCIVAARVNDLPGLYDPWVRYLISLRRVLLLQPTADDAFMFGAKVPPIPAPGTTGRGILIDQHQVTILQVAI